MVGRDFMCLTGEFMCLVDFNLLDMVILTGGFEVESTLRRSALYGLPTLSSEVASQAGRETRSL